MSKKGFISSDKKVYEKIQTYSNWKPLEKVTLNELHTYLKGTKLLVEGHSRDDSTENTRIPSLVLAFYYIIIRRKNNQPLSQKEYIDGYLELHNKWIIQKDNNVDIEDLKGRISRTYPSLVRELEFYMRLRESNQFEKVIYNLDDDLNGETDITVQLNGINYGLQLLLNLKIQINFTE